jgi:hypothetical protein
MKSYKILRSGGNISVPAEEIVIIATEGLVYLKDANGHIIGVVNVRAEGVLAVVEEK